MSIARGNERTNHRQPPGTTPTNAGSHFRRLPVCPGICRATLRRQHLIRPLIFCPSPLRHSIGQGLIHAPIFSSAPNERRAGRMPASWRDHCPAEREGWISSGRDSAAADTDTRRSYIR